MSAAPSRRPSRRLALALTITATLALSVVVAPATAPAHADVDTGLVLDYRLDQLSGTTVTDSSGSGRNGTLIGAGTWTGAEGLALDGTSASVKLPDNVLTGLSAVTVSTEVFIDPAQASPFFIWGLGNTATSGSGTGYLMASGNNFRAAITTGNWSAEKVTAKDPSSDLARGVWKTVTYTQTGTTGTLYEDGLQVGRNTAVTTSPGAVGSGATTNNLLGKSNYASDNLLKGKLRNFRIYDRALTPAEVATLGPTAESRVVADNAALDLGDLSAVTKNLTLPTTGASGSNISWSSSNPAVISTAGTVTRPAAGSAAATVTLTATVAFADARAAKDFTATVPPELTDQQKADAVAAAISVPNVDDARGNLTLPTTGTDGATIAWTSSDTATVSTSGIVTRPAPGADANAVALTATVTVGAAIATRVLSARVPARPTPEPFAGYTFSYFTGNSIPGEQIYFAASKGNNALQWTELNGGRPSLTSTMGTKGLRDPFLIRSPEGDKFYLLATDLSIGGGTSWGDAQTNGSKYMEVWESTDLINWGQQRHVKVAPDDAGDLWAPEAFWSDAEQAYVVFWASNVTRDGKTYHRIYTATTRDFVTFGAPKIWQDPGTSVIDSDVIVENGTYHRFTKDEGAVTGCSDIIQEKSTDLLAVDDISTPGYDKNNRNWKPVATCIGRGAGTSAVEGPTAFKANEGDTSGSKYYLFVDEYGGRGYLPLGTDSLDDPTWRVAPSYDLPASPRHGTVLPVTKTELDRLTNVPPKAATTADGLILDYTFDATSGTTVTDASGNGHDGTLAGDARWENGSLSLGGTNGHVTLPDNLMARLSAITVSTEVWIDPSQPTPYFLWGLGNTDAGGTGNGYLFATGDNYRTSLATGNWTTEQTVGQSGAVARGGWRTLTYTLADGTATLYLDGAKVGEKTGVTAVPGDIGGGRTTANYLGRSVYSADRYLKGKVRDFRIYDRALTAAEISALGDNATTVTGVTLASLKIPAIITPDANTVVLPVKPGTDLTALAPEFAVSAGSSVNETGARDYTAPRRIVVTAADGSHRTWTVSALVMGSPSLPGFNADPNIVRFGDTYYLYATTDGFPGWSSSSFKVWSSKDLVDWTEHPTILDLGPDVSWADTSAWAPTAVEKNGKYYFYFSAQQSIGVAVSDSPLGPFVDALGKPLVDKADYNGAQQIDPAVFTDDDGQSYLYWGNGAAYGVPLNDDMISFDVAQRVQFTGLRDFREGLFMNKRNGTYYLSWSIDDTRSENYRVGYATGSSPLGTFTSRGEILGKDASLGILGTGHHSIVQVPGTDDWYIAYHRFGMPGGDGMHRETTIDRLYFAADGSIERVVPTLTGVAPLAYLGAAPTARISGTQRGGWFTSGAALTVIGGDRDIALQYRIGTGPWKAWTTAVPLPNGSYDVGYRAQSVNLVWSVPATLRVKVDAVRPLVRGAAGGRTVWFAATDDDSKVALLQYRIDGGAWRPYTHRVTVDRAAHTVDARATDGAGNVSVVRSIKLAAVR